MSFDVVKIARNWPAHYLAKLTKPQYVSYRLRAGVEFVLRANTHDKAILKDVWAKRVYSPPGFEIRETDVIFDIGGHVGIFAVYAATQATRGMVLTFEPFQDNFEMLTGHIRRNGCRNVTAVNVAIGDTDGERTLNLSDDNTGGHSLVFASGGPRQVRVPTRSLASVMAEYKLDRIDFLKLDCEGAEFEILRDLAPPIFTKIARIALECHELGPGRTRRELCELLHSRGYGLTLVEGGTAADHPMIYAQRSS